jgi:hypothetical protein
MDFILAILLNPFSSFWRGFYLYNDLGIPKNYRVILLLTVPVSLILPLQR